ncbi:MAG: hypothetical protein ABGX83_00190 [Nitrospira sp.]
MKRISEDPTLPIKSLIINYYPDKEPEILINCDNSLVEDSLTSIVRGIRTLLEEEIYGEVG